MTDPIKGLGPDKVSLGVTPTLWWNDDFPLIDAGIGFEQCVGEMALAGFQGCSTGHKYPPDPARLSAALALRGLRVSEPWVSTYFAIGERELTISRFRQQLDFLDCLGETGRDADIVVAEFGRSSHLQPIPLFDHRPEFTGAEWDLLATGLDEIGRLAAERGRKLCYHHHMGTGVQTAQDVDELMRRTNRNLLHLLLDTGHLRFAGDDPLPVARRHADRIRHVHLKNVRQAVIDKVRADRLSFEDAVRGGVFTVPGDEEGAIEFEPVLQALSEAGYQGWLVVEAEQDPAKACPLEYAKKARDFLRETLGW